VRSGVKKAPVQPGNQPPKATMAEFTVKDPDYRQRVYDSFSRQQFMEHLGARLHELGPGFCEIHLDYAPHLAQQHGYFHGGVIGTLADNASGYASYTLMGREDSVLTVEYKLNLLAPGTGEKLISRGTVIRPGRTLIVSRSEVFSLNDNSEKLCATALVTLMALPGRPEQVK